MEYILLIIGFLSTLTAVIGKTFEREQRGSGKITAIGYITLTLALLALGLTSFLKYTSNKKAILKEQNYNKEFQELKLIAIQSRDTIKELNIDLLKLRERIHVYERLLSTIKEDTKQLEYVPKWTLASYYRLESNDRIYVEGTYYSGTQLKFMGFKCDRLILNYGGRTVKIPRASTHEEAYEVPLIGPSGKSFKLSLINYGINDCGGKIYAQTTERIDSDKWSWEGFEELLESEKDALIGQYYGKLDLKNIELHIDKIDGQVVFGKNTVGNNTRQIRGAITKNRNDYKIILIEPGTHEWDGKFEIQLSKDRNKIVGEGTWKSFNGKLRRTIKLKKK